MADFEIDDVKKQEISFFDFLKENGLLYPTDLVENFLLSLKAKQFVIFTGGSGTGKTKLAQKYGEYLSNKKTNQKILESYVTLDRLVSNGGCVLNQVNTIEVFPEIGVIKRENVNCSAKIGDCEIKGRIDPMVRFFYLKKEYHDTLDEEISKLKAEGKKKEKIYIQIEGDPTSVSEQYKIVPVGANWTENRFILGYLNALTGKYVTTNSLNLIINSNKNQIAPYLLVLDEMNLSHVERYFSDLLSAMESGEPIPLLPEEDSNNECIPKTIRIWPNLSIIGTVNVDETTYSFSPKVLDRANVIEFEPLSVGEYLNSGEINISPEGNDDYPRTQENGMNDPYHPPKGNVDFLQTPITDGSISAKKVTEIIDELEKNSANKSIVHELIGDLQKIQEIMNDLGFPIGFRTVDEIMRFMYAAWIYEGKKQFSQWGRYFDAQIKQKILPKISGNSDIEDKLKSLKELCENKNYRESKKKLSSMIAVLESKRYVSFNS